MAKTKGKKGKKWSEEEKNLLHALATMYSSRTEIVTSFQERFPERSETAILNKLKDTKIPIREVKSRQGDRFGYWIVLEEDTYGKAYIKCLCTGCNQISSVRKYGLENGTTKSCGCVKAKVQQETNLQLYGVIHPMQLSEYQQRAQDTNLEKYGVAHILQSQEFQKRIRQTTREKYGVDHYSQTEECKEKVKVTSRNLYGVDNYSQTEECKQKVKDTLIERYEVTNPGQMSDHQTKVKQTSQERYGVDYYMQAEEHQVRFKETMMERYGVDNYAKTEDFKDKIYQKNLEEGRLVCLSDGRPLGELCRERGASISYVYKILYTMGETAALDFLDKYQGKRIYYTTEQAFINLIGDAFGDSLQRWNRTPIEFKYSRRPDFRIEFQNKVLYVNTDGLFDHSIGGRTIRGDKFYHKRLAQDFIKNGCMIFQFREDELREKPEIVRSIVLNFFNQGKRIYARTCSIQRVKSEEATRFFEDNHLMGVHPKATAFGLFCKGELVSCMSVRRTKNRGLDIARFCNKIETSVLGGFSRLLKYVEQQYEPNYIQSFCDLRYTIGKSYISLGFKLEGVSLGWSWTDTSNTYNRLQCKANMDNRCLSQAQYAAELKWYQIYDAGQAKYIKFLNKKRSKK